MTQPGNGNIGQLNNNEMRAEQHAGAARWRPDCGLTPGDPLAIRGIRGIRGMRAFFLNPRNIMKKYYLNPRACSIQATGFTGAMASPGSRVSHTRRSITRNRIPLGGGRARAP